MKNPIRLLLGLITLCALCVLCGSPASAQTLPPEVVLADTAPTAADSIAAPAPLSWQHAVIAVLTPILIAGVKLAAPRIPRPWLPILAPILGFALDLISHFAAGTALNPTLALALGAAGVGLREAVDQLKQVAGRAVPEPPRAQF